MLILQKVKEVVLLISYRIECIVQRLNSKILLPTTPGVMHMAVLSSSSTPLARTTDPGRRPRNQL